MWRIYKKSIKIKKVLIPILAIALTLFACTNDDEAVFQDTVKSSIALDEQATTRACSLNETDSVISLVDNDSMASLANSYHIIGL